MDMENPHIRRIVFGLLWLAVGGLITLVTYSSAAPGGTYFIFGGAMVWGGIQVLWGLLVYSPTANIRLACERSMAEIRLLRISTIPT